jgi:hypothetical protein
MAQQIPCSNQRFNKAINPEEFNQIIEAILDGKYSWACVLLLRCAGYNPLQYIPYRTYNRLLKENCQLGRSKQGKTDTLKLVTQDTVSKSDNPASQKGSSKIVDLNYQEVVDEENAHIRGGSVASWSFRGN